jgi:DNA-binding MarR family transcriptional regulator
MMNRLCLAEFADRINEIVPVIMKEFTKRQTGELYKTKVTLPQFLILVLLQREGETKMTDLAHMVKVTTAAMTGIGYAVRAYDPQDRRIIKVKATTKGSQLVKKVNEERRKMIIKIFGKLSESDRTDYLRILTQIKEALIKEGPVVK